MHFIHSPFRAEDQRAGHFYQLVNSADSEYQQRCAHPKAPASQAIRILQPASNNQPSGDSENEMDVSIKFKSVIEMPVSSESAEIMHQQRDGEYRIMDWMHMKKVAQEINTPQKWP